MVWWPLTQLKGTCQRRCLHNSHQALRQPSHPRRPGPVDPRPLTPPAPRRHDASPTEDRVHSFFRWTRRRPGSRPFPLAETRWCSCDLHFSGCGDLRDLFVGFKRARVCCPIPRQALGRGFRRIGFEFINRSRCGSWFFPRFCFFFFLASKYRIVQNFRLGFILRRRNLNGLASAWMQCFIP